MLTQEESKALRTFLDRVNLSGSEAQTMVYLQNRINQMTEEASEETDSQPSEDHVSEELKDKKKKNA